MPRGKEAAKAKAKRRTRGKAKPMEKCGETQRGRGRGRGRGTGTRGRPKKRAAAVVAQPLLPLCDKASVSDGAHSEVAASGSPSGGGTEPSDQATWVEIFGTVSTAGDLACYKSRFFVGVDIF
jgi:hypothetical protein